MELLISRSDGNVLLEVVDGDTNLSRLMTPDEAIKHGRRLIAAAIAVREYLTGLRRTASSSAANQGNSTRSQLIRSRGLMV